MNALGLRVVIALLIVVEFMVFSGAAKNRTKIPVKHFLFNNPSKVCYEKYGCFSKQPSVRWGLISIQPSLPQNPSAVGTTFDLYTKEGYGRIDDFDTDKLKAPKFDMSRRTIFVIHGWRESATKGWTIELKDALLQREDCNVILVDWSKGAKRRYGQSVGNTRLVGAQVAELIRFLINSTSRSPDSAKRFYIVGFSLGGQTAGYVGRYLKEKAGMTLGRITGLDPAGPCFNSISDPRFRLDPSDAEYVDVIHTDMTKNSGFVGFGMRREGGHADFFPNGGIDQRGCLRHLVELEFVQTVKCDHQRAWKYFIASVKNPRSWEAHPCKDYYDCEKGKFQACDGECPTMGYGADKTKPIGKFYLMTSRGAPFLGLSPDASMEEDNYGSP